MNGMQLEPGSVSASPRPEAPADSPNQLLSAHFFQDTSRIDVDSLMNEFRRQLGAAKWDKYRDALTHFLMGKLTRAELVRTLQESLGMNNTMIRNHNILILSLLASACRELPPGTESSLAEWRTKARGKSRYAVVDSSNDNLHREILSLPGRERKRIKAIAKETASAASGGKRPIVYPPPPVILATRQALLPHVPYVQDFLGHRDKERAKKAEAAGSAAAAAQTVTPASAKSASRASYAKDAKEAKEVAAAAAAAAAKDKDSTPNPTSAGSLLDPSSSLHAGRNSGPLTWAQDIIQGLDAPLATESYEIPDDAVVGTRMLGIALEHGLLDGIGAGTTDIMLLGVETYLRGLIEQLATLRHRKISSSEPLNAADLALFADMNPTEIGELSAPLYRLKMNFLNDEETVVPAGAGAGAGVGVGAGAGASADADASIAAPTAAATGAAVVPIAPSGSELGQDGENINKTASPADNASGVEATTKPGARKRATPLDFPVHQAPKLVYPGRVAPKTEEQAALEHRLLKEHNNGLQLLGDLLN